MRFLCRLLRQNPDSREGNIAAVSLLGMAVNLLIAAAKVIVGLLAASIAIVSEGVNNATDALTSLLTLVGTKLAGMHPDEKHPFGYGRIEYLTGLVISVIILVAGVEMLKSSIALIFSPEKLKISTLSLVIVAVSAVIKFVLGTFTIKAGHKTDSSALTGVGLDCRNDAFVSVITIVSALVFLIFGLSVDAYAGIVVSLLILKAGGEVLFATVSELLGRPGDEKLAARLYQKIRSADGVLNAADMMLHCYGPDRYSGSVNVEMDHEKTVGEVYELLHKLQLQIMHEEKVTMVFGIYAVDNDHEEVRALRKHIGAFVSGNEHIRSLHAIYLDPESRRIYCDFVVDYKLRDWDGLKAAFLDYMKKDYPDNEIELTIETDYV